MTYVGDTDFNLDVNGVVLTFKKWAIGSTETVMTEDLVESEDIESFELED